MPTDDEKYQQRMQRKKSHIDKRISEATINRGIIVLLTGNGKGKSSAAFGMVCRSLGHGFNIVIAKFLKGKQDSGEDIFFKNQSNIRTILMKTGFTWDTQDKAADTRKALETWAKVAVVLRDSSINLLVLDELTYMINYQYLDETMVLEALKNRPKNQHVVITGRAASKNLQKIADTVSEITDKKHAFRDNIKAQIGIDL